MQKLMIVIFSLLVLNSYGQYDNWDLVKPFETTWSKVYSDSAIDVVKSGDILGSINTYTVQGEDHLTVYGSFRGLRYPIKEYDDERMMMPPFLIDANISGDFKIELLDRGYTVSVRNIYSHINDGNRVYIGAGVTRSIERVDPLEDFIWKKNRRLKIELVRSILPRLNRLFTDSFNLKALENKRDG